MSNHMKDNRVGIIAPTGHGKTAMMAITVPLWMAYFLRNKQALIVSNSLAQSMRIIDEFKATVENNEMLIALMPERHEQTWTKTEIVTTTGFRMICRPYSENIKGFHVDYVLCDEASSYRDHSIFFRFVQTRVEAKRGTVCCISTPDNIADLMQVLRKRKGYVSMIYPAITEGKPLWPGHFGIERLERIKQQIGEAAFEREYMCNPQAVRDGSIYPPNLVQQSFNYGEKFVASPSGEGEVIVAADFAISEGSEADYDVYVVIQRVGKKIVLLHGERHKGFPVHAKIQSLSVLAEKYKPIFIVCDPSMIGDAVIEGLKQSGYQARAADFHSVNRGKMLIKLRQAFENNEIVLPYDPEDMVASNFVNTLAGELIQMEEKRSPATQQITFMSTGAHDDCVMALAAAVSSIVEQKGCFEFGGV
jgi:phage terminase large subunit-like protein